MEWIFYKYDKPRTPLKAPERSKKLKNIAHLGLFHAFMWLQTVFKERVILEQNLAM